MKNQIVPVTMLENRRCHRCVVIYEKHKNVLQYKESECEDMYSEPNPAAMPMRSVLKSDHTRSGTHPNINGANNRGGLNSGGDGIGGGGSSHSRLTSSDPFVLRSQDDFDNCKHFNIIYIFLT